MAIAPGFVPTVYVAAVGDVGNVGIVTCPPPPPQPTKAKHIVNARGSATTIFNPVLILFASFRCSAQPQIGGTGIDAPTRYITAGAAGGEGTRPE
jgi:hypothetical protein